MTEKHWKILVNLLWSIGNMALIAGRQDAESLKIWRETCDTAQMVPWRSE